MNWTQSITDRTKSYPVQRENMSQQNKNPGIGVDKAFEIYSKDEGVIIDVRSYDEFTKQHISNSISIPLEEIKSRIEELPSETKIIFVCNSGNKRCTAAYDVVAEQGLDEASLYKIDGGTKEWIQKGYPTNSAKS